MANIKQIINGDDKLIQSGAIIEFSYNELVILSNALYEYFKNSNSNEMRDRLKDTIYIASQISQYGHMDNLAVSVLSCDIKDN